MALFPAKVQDAKSAPTGSIHPLARVQAGQLVLVLPAMCIAQIAHRGQLLASVLLRTQALSAPQIPIAPALARVSTQLG